MTTKTFMDETAVAGTTAGGTKAAAIAVWLALAAGPAFAQAQQPARATAGRAAPAAPGKPTAAPGMGVNKGHPLPTTITAQDARPNPNQVPAAQQVEFNLKWNPIDFPLKPRVFELAQQASEMLGETKHTKDFRRVLPVVQELVDGRIFVPQGGVKMVALVLENTTDKPVYFFASPHATDPLTAGWGTKFSCLCNGLHYRVRPHSTWYRVMALRVTPTNQSSKFTFIHNIHGIDPRDLPAPSDEVGD